MRLVQLGWMVGLLAMWQSVEWILENVSAAEGEYIWDNALMQDVGQVCRAGFVILMLIAAYRLVDYLDAFIVVEGDNMAARRSLASVAEAIGRLAVVVVGVFVLAGLVGLNLNGMIAGLGITGLALALAAKDSVAGLPVTVKIWDEKALEKDNCGGIQGVGKGSSRPPRLVRMTYAPRGATSHVALVGKGITFDTGGISIKPAANMDEMKADMSGAAAVIGAMRAIASLGLSVKVTGWVPAAENMPSGTAQRPGDVLRTYSGTTVEVLNTDAEGRLVLADALGMAVEDAPDLIVDVATLTGAQRIALGSRTAGVMANNDDARTQVIDAANAAGEAMWPMPLPEDLRPSLDSATADIANIGDRLGGMLSAGIFLSEFIPADQPWVHIDIAGPAFNEKSAYGYTPKGGTGAAVRTFVELVEDFTRD